MTTTTEYRTYTDPCPGKKGTDRIEEDCYRCGGSGEWTYGMVTNVLHYTGRVTGRFCFECSGRGKVSVKVSSVRARARREVKAHNANIDQAIAWEAERVEREAAELAECIEEAYAEHARREARVDVPEGIEDVVGKIISIKGVDGYYGGMSLKMLVEDDRGFRVYGTFPTAFYSDKQDANKGDRVSFNAALVRKDHDFGFFKRPTQCKVIERAATEEA